MKPDNLPKFEEFNTSKKSTISMKKERRDEKRNTKKTKSLRKDLVLASVKLLTSKTRALRHHNSQK
jgi:hypothetical protein